MELRESAWCTAAGRTTRTNLGTPDAAQVFSKTCRRTPDAIKTIMFLYVTLPLAPGVFLPSLALVYYTFDSSSNIPARLVQ